MWCGRFGNNIQQISNAIYFSKKNFLKFTCPDNNLINNFFIKYGETECPPSSYFFYKKSETNQGGPDFECDVEDLRRQRVKICKEIYPHLKINHSNVYSLDETIVVASIRSGDIFSRKNYYCPVVSKYIQNPLSYYLNIISKYKKCIVLTEDYLNPVVLELANINNVEIKICDIKETLEVALSTKNLITSGVSTFSIACALLSKNIKNLYCTNIIMDEILSYKDIQDENIKIHKTNIDLTKYISEWLNTEQQRKLMISYE
jgi:hypothetical protein